MLCDTKESTKELWGRVLRPLALFSEMYLDSKQKQKCHALKNNSFYFYVKAFHPSPQVLILLGRKDIFTDYFIQTSHIVLNFVEMHCFIMPWLKIFAKS